MNLQSTTLSVGQQKSIVILSIASIVLSFFGSASIIQTIRNSKKQKGAFERILLCLSISDIYVTIVYFFQIFLTPKRSRVWSWGSETSCSILGGSLQFAQSGTYINTILSIHYFLTIVHGIRGQGIFLRIEPWLYAFGFLWAVVTTTAGFLLNAYRQSELSGLCWVVCYDSDNGYEHCPQLIVAYSFSAPILVCFGTIGYCMISIKRHVKSIIQQHNERSIVRQIRRSSSNDHGDSFTLPALSVSSSPPPATTVADESNTMLRMVSSQAVLYIGAYFALTPWTMFLLTYESFVVEQGRFDLIDSGKFFPIIALQSIFLPLQGLLNYMIFMRPRFIDLRRKNPSWSRWHTVWRVVCSAYNNLSDNEERKNTGRLNSSIQSESRVIKENEVSDIVSMDHERNSGGRYFEVVSR